MDEVVFNREDNTYTFNCIYCRVSIQLFANEIACGIFRCGIYKNSYQNINPHMPKIECDRLYAEGLIFGCGKPFRFVYENPCRIEQCDYI